MTSLLLLLLFVIAGVGASFLHIAYRMCRGYLMDYAVTFGIFIGAVGAGLNIAAACYYLTGVQTC